MKIGTGRTIYDVIFSLDGKNNPVTGVSYSVDVYRDGMTQTGVTVNLALANASTGAYTGSWSANTVGDYQIYYKNDITNVVFVTETYNVVPDDQVGTNVYIGL